MSLGNNIRKYRKERGFTQKQLGELCGINEAQIRRYELGGTNSNPKLETIRKIAEALEVYIGDLNPDWREFSQDEILIDLAINEKKLLQNYRSLNGKGQEKAVEQVEMLTKIPEYRKED